MIRPGNYDDYLAMFRRWSPLALALERARLAQYKYGCAWPRSNYSRALMRACAEKLA